MKFPLFHSEFIIPTIIALIFRFFGNKLSNDYYLYLFILNSVVIFVSTIIFLRNVTIQITNYLGIYLLKIKYEEKKEK